MSDVMDFMPQPFCDFCGRTARQIEEEEGHNFLVVSQRHGRAAICTICVADIVDAVLEKARDEGIIEGDGDDDGTREGS